MQQSVVEHDSVVGLGPQGPVLAALRREARASLAPVNSHAVVLATLSSSGALDLRLISASRNFAAWGQVAERARAALRKTALPLPAGARGLELEIRIDSRAQLPSGADPGLAVDLLSIPLREGKGKRSSRISLLEPKLELTEEEVRMPGGDTVKLPRLRFGINVLGIGGDPADLGAKARRVVNVRVQRQRVL
jgi:hypothetical protein